MKTSAPVLSAQSQSATGKMRGLQPRTLDQEKARLRKATQEFEAFFKYQMLKTMRQTIPKDPFSDETSMGGSEGKETFTDMMDMEVAKVGAGGRGSIADILYRSMLKRVEAQYAQPEQPAAAAKALPLRPVVQAHVNPVPLIKPAMKLHRSHDPKPAELKLRTLPAHRPTATSPHINILERFGPHIEAAAAETKLDSALIASVISAESSGNPRAVSARGAKGLMQLAGTTAQDYDVANVFDPAENIRAGARFLKKLVDKYQNVKLALAAYNAGPANVDKYGGLPPFKETHEYVRKVLAAVGDAVGVTGGSKAP